MEGWISIHRNIWGNWTWEDRPFSKGQAWIDLLLLVNHEDNQFPFDGKLVLVKRGSKITSIRKLCDRWGWSNTKVVNFLKLLQEDKMITYKSDSKKTFITIVKYSDYQDRRNDKTTQKRQRNDTETTVKHTNNNDNNDNKSLYSDFVNKMLPIYPGKKIKAVRDKRLPKILEQYSEDEILRAVNRYAAEVAGKEKQFILNESTFWNSRYVDYLDENYEEEPRYNLGSEKYL